MSNVLIIDDEIDICFLLSSILRNKNMNTVHVNTLTDATEVLQKERPSIIFLDNHLPDGMGMDFISYIKRASPLTKIVMITAYDNSTDRNKALQLGADFFIGKPFSRDSIYHTIEQLAY
ncbi:response regulator [Ferruginibacter albus]|uniref:response regulator n=1 Tax=Ferruginibacter albus TaxID=2875540 RepID=UPI001CC6788A|nr:response regulator [Ferruginibacter albus]UAY51969.1 response regulator [Ferruginibacter albus]